MNLEKKIELLLEHKNQKSKSNIFTRIINKIILFFIFVFLLNYLGILNIFENPGKNEEKKSILEKFMNINTIKTPKNKAFKLIIPDELPIYKIGISFQYSFIDSFMNIFKKKIYPVNFDDKFKYTKGDLNSINLLKNNKLDLAFIDENTLLDYKMKHDINFSVVCVCFKNSFIFITLSTSPIYNFNDIFTKKIQVNQNKMRNVRIGVMNQNSTEYQQLLKMIAPLNIDIINDIEIVQYNDYLTMSNDLLLNKIDVTYFLSLQKNEIIYNLTNKEKCRFITPKNNFKNLDFSMNNFSQGPFIYLIQNQKKPQLEDIFNKKNKIIYHEADKFELISLLEICQYLFKTNVDNYLKNYCQSFEKIDNMSSELFKLYKKTNVQHFLFITQKKIKREKQLEKILMLSQLNKINSNIFYLYTNRRFVEKIEKDYFYNLKKNKDRNYLIKNNFNALFNSLIELNTYSNNINTNTYIETFGTRLLLVCRNEIPKKNINILLENFLQQRDSIVNTYTYYLNMGNKFLNNDEKELESLKLNLTLKPDNTIFKINEMGSVIDLPIHPGALKLYKKLGLIKQFIEYKSDINNTISL